MRTRTIRAVAIGCVGNQNPSPVLREFQEVAHDICLRTRILDREEREEKGERVEWSHFGSSASQTFHSAGLSGTCVLPRRSRALEYVFSAEIFMISCDLLVSFIVIHTVGYLHVFKGHDDFKICGSFHVHSHADTVEEHVLLSALLRIFRLVCRGGGQ